MESSIAGMLILSVLIVAVVLMSRAYVVSNTLLGTAMVESVNLADERSRTGFSIDSVTASQDTLAITATNTGSVPITEYDRMDVFVGDKRLTYATSTPEADQWAILGGGTWNPRQERSIEINASTTPGTTVVVSLPSGGAEVAAVPAPTPTPTPAPTPTSKQITISCNNPTVTPATITSTTTSITVTCP